MSDIVKDNIERVEWTLQDPEWKPTRSYVEKLLASYKELSALVERRTEGKTVNDDLVKRLRSMHGWPAEAADEIERLRIQVERQQEADASIVEQTVKHLITARENKLVKLALGMAARAIRRGRHLTDAERLANLKAALTETDDEPAFPSDDSRG